MAGPGFANIDQCRNEAATEVAAADSMKSSGSTPTSPFMLTPSIGCEAITCRLSPASIRRRPNGRSPPGYSRDRKEVQFGGTGGVIEILYAVTGFLHTRREVYELIRTHCELPTCNEQWGKPSVPYFLPMVIDTEKGPWYLGDDFSFCHRGGKQASRCTPIRRFVWATSAAMLLAGKTSAEVEPALRKL